MHTTLIPTFAEATAGKRLLSAFVVATVLLAGADVFAQALPNLNSARVAYNTRKATVKPEGDLKAQIDQIDKEMAAAVSLGRLGEYRRLLAKGMALLGGRTWTDADEFQASLAIRTDRMAVDSSTPYRVRLEQIFPPSIELSRPLTARAALRPRVPPAQPRPTCGGRPASATGHRRRSSSGRSKVSLVICASRRFRSRSISRPCPTARTALPWKSSIRIDRLGRPR